MLTVLLCLAALPFAVLGLYLAWVLLCLCWFVFVALVFEAYCALSRLAAGGLRFVNSIANLLFP
mgnify:FL=1